MDLPNPPELTDAAALARNRARALRFATPALFLQETALQDLQERLAVVNRTFRAPAIVSGFPELWQGLYPDAKLLPDRELLDLEPGAHDLVVHAMALHWANDAVGQLIQCRRALQPDGLFLGICFGGRTLQELRAALTEAESRSRGGLSPRVAPMGDIRDLGGLLQRAGFALPVADSDLQKVSYRSARHLMQDLRAMGEASALQQRPRHFTARAVFDLADRLYAENFATTGGRVTASFELVTLTGWAPAPGQPQPLRPGSAEARLADALNTKETPLGD